MVANHVLLDTLLAFNVVKELAHFWMLPTHQQAGYLDICVALLSLTLSLPIGREVANNIHCE